MKSTQIFLLVTALSVICTPAAANPQHGAAPDSSATVNIQRDDSAFCGTAVFDELYALTVVVFEVGADNVNLAEYEQKFFALAVTSPLFAGGSVESITDHLKAIPGQLIEIIREDPSVLDSCSNFSVALVGPP